MFKRELKKEISKRNGISFKTATIIVVGFHLLGFAGITLWSSHKARVAREARVLENERRTELMNTKDIKWPTSDLTPKVLAVAPTPKPAPMSKETSSKSWWHIFFNHSSSEQYIAKQPVQPIINNPAPEQDKAVKLALKKLEDTTKELEKVKRELAVAKQPQAKPTPKSSPSSSTKVIASSRVTVKQGKVVSRQQTQETTLPVTTKIEVRPDNARTYKSNGFNYVNLDNLLSSHITLD